MGRVISISNQKGGVGKTTSAINISAFLAEKGQRVLIIDIDPQANAGFGLGINPENVNTTIYEVLIGQTPIKNAIVKTEVESLYIIPSNIHLSGAQVELLNVNDREFILKNALKEIKNSFDFIFIDCPPSLGILTLNSLVAADTVIIPLQCEYYALEGLSQLLKVIAMVQKSLNKKLKIEGVILTMYDPRTNLSQQIVSDVREYFKDKTLKTIVSRNVKLAEAPSFGKPIGLYDRDCSGSESYIRLAEEVLNNG
ncbi:MAG: AAA family ATPase [Spirochaetota bacterium]|nr:AAA family ATPase [Spirochaetota bacterium]